MVRPMSDTEALTRLIRELRTGYHRLTRLATALGADLGLTPPQRAVLEGLAAGPRTVPDLARERGVSRQHIQTLANALAEAGLVETADNPAHRRSPLYRLTAAGRARFDALVAREAGPLEALAGALGHGEAARAGAILARLNAALETLSDGKK